MTEQEIIKIGVDEYKEIQKIRQRRVEIEAEIKRLEAELRTLPENFMTVPKWQMYLYDKIEAEIKLMESNDQVEPEGASK